MGRGRLSSDEIRLLSENPNVLEVSENRIIYTNEFKKLFMEEYLSGHKGPTQIFRDAGFDTAVLGSKRIERAAARWRESYAAGSLGAYKDGEIRHRELMEDPDLTDKEKKKLTLQQANRKLSKKQRQIEMLKQENEMLRKHIHLLLTKQELNTQ